MNESVEMRLDDLRAAGREKEATAIERIMDPDCDLTERQFHATFLLMRLTYGPRS